MKTFTVSLKSTTFREVEVEAKDRDEAVDNAIAQLEHEASRVWLENAEEDFVKLKDKLV